MILHPVSVSSLAPDCECLVRFQFTNGLVRNYLAIWRGDDWSLIEPANDEARFRRMWSARDASISVYSVSHAEDAR